MRRRPLAVKTLDLLTVPSSEPTAPRLWTRRDPAGERREEPPHLHRFFELVFIEEGEGTHAIDGQRFEASPGDAFWIAPGQLHDAAELYGTTKWLIAFGAEVLTPGQTEAAPLLDASSHSWQMPFALARRGHCRATLPPAQCESWRARLGQLEHELETRPLGYAEASRALLQLLLLDVTRLVSAGGVEPARASTPLLEAVFAFIEDNYRRPIGLRDVARAVNRSPAYLTDMVHRETGRPIFGWIAERRLAEARRLLLLSGESIEEIASAVGYGDARHFSRQFRQHTGLPPRAWRKARLAPKETAHSPKRRAL